VRAGHRLRVAVVGGGIGGLTAAIALHRAGLDVNVYEQGEFTEVGAGVALGPNALTLLRRLGLEQRLESVAAHPTGYEMRRGRDGRVIFETHSSGPLRGMRSLTLHRGHLLQVLLEAMPRERLHTGRRCVGVEERADGVLALFADGSTAAADALVGADGIHSTVRSLRHEDRPVFSGTVAYRGLIPMERLPFLRGERRQLTFWFGPRRHFLTFPVARGTLMNLVAFVPAGDGWAEESWAARGEVAELARQFEGWEPAVVGTVRALEGTMRWALYDREPLPAWSVGRVTLLGDAAHAMLPHQGQGAVQSIEDAVVLARCLARAEPDEVPRWLTLYERLRKPRAERVQEASRLTGEIYRLADAAEQERRVPSALATRGEWLWNYDADRAFEEALAGGLPDLAERGRLE
jgi:salicylate hydroxylase